MTVADNTSRNQYTATPSQALFAYTFEIVDKDDIVVLINGTPLSEGTDYTVTGVGSDTGGNIVLTSGTTGGNIVTIYRDMPYSRTQNYTNSGDFLASEVNSDFDNLWLAGEQTNRAFSQSIRKPITDSDSISMELPEAASRASKFLKFDANGAVDLAAGVTTDVDADDVSIADAGGYYTSDNVEGALQEIGAQPPGFDPNTDSFNIGSDAVSSGTDSIALGHDASATAARDIALGFDAVASGGGSIAIGQETDSTGVRSIAIGKGAQSTFSTSIALGEDASTLGGAGGSPVAIGYNASSTGISGISLGPNTTASGSQSISIGDSVSATGTGSTALGQNASVTGSYSTALGFGATVTATTAAIAINDATASGVGSMAIHDNSLSSGSYSMAIGYGSQATVASAMAVGYSSEATAVSSTALGHDASATGDKSIAIGFESSASFVDAIAIGTDTRSDALGSIAIGTGSDASQLGSVALGKGAQATGAGSTIAIGEAATTSGGLASPIAIGYQANTTGAYGVGLGYQTVTSGAQSIAIGYIASATNDNSIAIGRQLTVAGQKAVGIGWGAVAGSYDSIGIGTSANASTTDCISIGKNSESLSTGGIAIGGGASISVGNIKGVAVGYAAQAQQIGGVAVGNNAICNSQFGTALGRDSNASSGSYATALGYGSVASDYGTAINNSDATGARSVAIGHSAVSSSADSIAIGYNADALGTDSIAIGNIAGADAENTIHINASGVDTNQPQTAGYIVIETDDASLKYDGSWDLTGGPLNLSGGIDVGGDVAFGDNDKAIFGAGSDLQIYHSGTTSFITENGTGDLRISGNNLLLRSDDIFVQSEDGTANAARFNSSTGVTLYRAGAAKLATTSTGIDVTGTATTDGLTIGATDRIYLDGGSNTYIQESASDDLRFFVGGSQAVRVRASSTDILGTVTADGAELSGNLTLNYAYPRIKLTDSDSNSDYSIINDNGEFGIYDDTNNAFRLKIDTNGNLDVGAVTADGLTVDGSAAFNLGAGEEVSIYRSTDFAVLRLGASSTDHWSFQEAGTNSLYIGSTDSGTSVNRLRLDNNGDMALYEDTGTTPKFFWDSSAESLDLTGAGGLDVNTATGSVNIQAGNASADIALGIGSPSTANKVVVTAGGSVGIGTSSPQAITEIVGSNSGGALDVLNLRNAGGDGSQVTINMISSTDETNTAARSFIKSIRSGSSPNLTFGTANTERMRITSAGQVGIGTSSPSQDLEILNGTTGAGIRLAATDAAYWDIERDATSGHLTFTDDGAGTVLTVGQDGLVGIGNSAPTTALDVTGTIKASGNGKLQITDDTEGSTFEFNVGGGGALEIYDDSTERMRIDSSGVVQISNTTPTLKFTDTDNNYDATIQGLSGSLVLTADSGAEFGTESIQFKTAGSEAMRIDSSQNLLVGKPSASSATVGFQAGQDGFIAATRASGQPLVLNRTTTDGTIADFRKDGTTVGSIGTASTSTYIDGGSELSGLQFGGDGTSEGRVVPRRDGAIADGETTLGTSSYRFKDLYLSGGVYLGGTGAANKLDDYEEGTFTPAFVITNCTVTHDIQQGNYTKVGNTVFFHLSIGTSAASGSFSGSNVLITGMPFATSRTQTGATGLAHSWASELDDPSWAISSGTTVMSFYKANNAAGLIVGAQFATGGSSNRLDVTGCYHTDS